MAFIINLTCILFVLLAAELVVRLIHQNLVVERRNGVGHELIVESRVVWMELLPGHRPVERLVG